MKLSVNRHILSLKTLDSGSVTPMMSVMHRFRTPGRYNVTVFQGDERVMSFDLVVDKSAPMAITKVDLSSIDCQAYTVNPQAYVLFYAPRGGGGYRVMVKGSGRAKSTVFDSYELSAGDVFMVALLRPGHYSAMNQYGAKCEISVGRLRKNAFRFIPTLGRVVIGRGIAPISIKCTKGIFRPKRVDVEPAQAIHFMIKAPLRIKVELMEIPTVKSM